MVEIRQNKAENEQFKEFLQNEYNLDRKSKFEKKLILLNQKIAINKNNFRYLAMGK